LGNLSVLPAVFTALGIDDTQLMTFTKPCDGLAKNIEISSEISSKKSDLQTSAEVDDLIDLIHFDTND
jgi:hypothetical protein